MEVLQIFCVGFQMAVGPMLFATGKFGGLNEVFVYASSLLPCIPEVFIVLVTNNDNLRKVERDYGTVCESSSFY
jgi:hypothetical protein